MYMQTVFTYSNIKQKEILEWWLLQSTLSTYKRYICIQYVAPFLAACLSTRFLDLFPNWSRYLGDRFIKLLNLYFQKITIYLEVLLSLDTTYRWVRHAMRHTSLVSYINICYLKKYINFVVNYFCSLSLRRAAHGSKRIHLDHTHGLFIT